ncbi:thiaminase II [Alkalihalophilus pseudofirmus]|uniref:Aminopyrimidine aminohydrolase n=1 Tax=Alkalihalophilus pseudofirmus TaxID=79885 RepID=A0AAJ2KS54_ALKPS|nr:thiaminase II [Alkalihalophilus pseudofirmus]MDV2883887.1 thiaminase II [Alkalihalophilus pseudofirmus]OLS35655.1 thiaminase II [Alkalihalophilus pseudofirmus]WEG17919.1 thiaminase II [Alkalihalophilus pseudofirmus]
MSFSARLHQNSLPIWEASHNHPFVKGIGDGTLDIEKFKFFMKQDYVYLIDYARLFALASMKATSLKNMALFAKMLDATLNIEMDLHRQYAERLGISAEELEATQAAPMTLAYSSYMLSVSERGSLIDLVTAILPCAWSYYEIGKKLAEIPGAMEHEFYGEWITMYQSEEFGEIADWLINLLDELALGLPESELARLEEIFLNTSRFEYMFWDMSYKEESWPSHVR